MKKKSFGDRQQLRCRTSAFLVGFVGLISLNQRCVYFYFLLRRGEIKHFSADSVISVTVSQ